MSPPRVSRQTIGRAFAAMVLSTALGTAVAPADGLAAPKTNVSLAAAPAAEPASARVSPHARAARQRAAAQAAAAASGIRASPFDKRKPHNLRGAP